MSTRTLPRLNLVVILSLLASLLPIPQVIQAAPDDAATLALPRSLQASGAPLPGWFSLQPGLAVRQHDLQQLWLPPARPVP
jgi:hypothetical protein